MGERIEALRVSAVLGDALRYAGAYLGDALRLCWAPVILLLLWARWSPAYLGEPIAELLQGRDLSPSLDALVRGGVGLAFGIVPLFLTASYMAPLVLQASARSQPSHRTLPNKIGGPELRWSLGTVLSAGGLFLLASAPVGVALSGLERLAEHAWTAEVATFEAGSLHASDLQPAYPEALRTFLSGDAVMLPGGLSVPTGAPGVLVVVGLLLFAYCWLRFFPLPAVLTAGSGGRGVIRATLAASAGWNIARLAAVVALTAIANVVLVLVLGWVPILVNSALGAAYPFLAGVSAFSAGGEIEPWVRETLVLLSQAFEVGFLILVTAFGAAVNAGVLGAIVRRVTG